MADGLTGREEERAPAVLGFAACAISGFVVGLLVHEGWASAALVASLVLVAGTAGWVLRGLR
ncbi:hypothetical protein FMGBMHLM_1912 [Methylobacterium aerolatum]|nr:hypothetical protein FMGBMHLM_1912 [Methylobacterium aerolatum]